MTRTLSIAAALSLLAVASPAQADPWEQAAAEMNAALTAFKAEKGKNCDSANLANAKLASDKWESYSIQYFNYVHGDRSAVEEVSKSLSGRLTLADAALKANCLDMADEIYREVISTYTGSRFAAFRERAKLGVDDVRAKRK